MLTIDELNKLNEANKLKVEELQRANLKLEEETALRKQLQKELFESNALYRTTLYSIGDAVISTDIEGNIVFMNAVAELLTGWSLTNAKGRPLNEVFHIINQQTRIVCNNPVEIVLQKGEVVGLTNHTALISKDGSEYIISDSGSPIRNKNGEITGTVLVFKDDTETYLKAEKLRRSEIELKKVQQITHIGSWYLDVATNEVTWTEELYRMYGFDPGLPPPPYTEHMKLFTPESWETLSSSLARTAETGVPYELELRTIRDNRTNGWMWVRGESIRDATGKTLALWGAAQDISQRKEVEDELLKSKKAAEESEIRYRTVVSNSPLVTFVINPDGIFTLSEGKGLEKLGLKPGQIVGLSVFDFYKGYPLILNDIKEALAGKSIRSEIVLPGVVFDVFYTPVFDEKGILIEVIGVANDITERKYAEELLSQSKTELEDYFENDIAADYVVLAEGEILSCNKTFVEMFGFKEKSQAIKLNITQLYRNPDDRREMISLVKKTGKVENFEVDFVSCDGKIINAIINAIGIFNKSGDLEKIRAYIVDISRQKNIEKELQNSEEKYRSLFANNSQPMWIYDLETLEFLEVNKAAIDHYGYSKDEFLSMTLKDIRPTEDIPALLKDVDNTSSILNSAGEWRHLKKNGDIIDVEITSHFVFFNYRNAQHILINDITERKRVQLEYQTMIKTSRDGFWIVDFDTGQFIEVNQSYCDMIEYSREELLKMTISDIEAVENHEETRKHIELIIKKGFDSFESKHKTKSGKIIDIDASVTFMGSEIKKFFVIVKDISERKRSEKELLKLSHAVEQIPLTILITNTKGNIEFVNPAFTRITGYLPEEIKGENPRILKSGETRPEEYKKLWNTITAGKIWNGEFHNRKKNGELYWESATIAPIFDGKGKIINYITIKEDITKQKELFQDLIQAKEKAEESDRLKSAFLANMSHEIRTPMNGILGFTELLLEPDLTSEQKENYIKIVNQSGQRMLNTVNDIVEISKIEAGIVSVNLKEIDVRKTMVELIRFFTPEATNKSLKLILENEVPKVSAVITTDQNKFDSILTNLIKNAIKFTLNGEIRVGCNVKANKLEFYVKDTGIGIPQERHQAIFERFIQADILDLDARQGSGLGLAISKAYVEMLGGKIFVESKTGEGSTFFFTLPLKEQFLEKTEENETVNMEDKTNKIKGLNIIIAEDDENSAFYLKTILENESDIIIIAKNGIETVEACRNNPNIDLILMDVQMPGMNGYEATREIRKFNKKVVIIAQTAFALMSDREKAREAGCNDYIAKPIKKSDLIVLLQKYFG